MTAREKIEQLTHTWYGFTVFAAVASVVEIALWPLSPGLLFSPLKLVFAFLGSAIAVVFAIGLHFVGVVIGVLIVRLLGRGLLARSSFTRVVLVVFSALFAVFGALSALRQLWSGLSQVSLSFLLSGAISVVAVTLYVRSYRVLTDPEVRAYVAGG